MRFAKPLLPCFNETTLFQLFEDADDGSLGCTDQLCDLVLVEQEIHPVLVVEAFGVLSTSHHSIEEKAIRPFSVDGNAFEPHR